MASAVVRIYVSCCFYLPPSVTAINILAETLNGLESTPNDNMYHKKKKKSGCCVPGGDHGKKKFFSRNITNIRPIRTVLFEN